MAFLVILTGLFAFATYRVLRPPRQTPAGTSSGGDSGIGCGGGVEIGHLMPLPFNGEAVEYADSHTRPVPEESWALLEWLAPRTPIRAVIIERDDDLPPFGDLLSEVTRAREILDAAGRPAA